MDYKKIISSRKLRLKILSMLSFVPDRPMIQLQYWMKTGRKLNLKNPQRFTEKLQWYKLNYKNPEMVRCVDKYDVRAYVEERGLKSLLIPCLGVYDSVDDVDWSALPQRFVMKDTLGGGGASVAIVREKTDGEIARLKQLGREWTALDAHRRGQGREWPYYSGKNHRIIIEQFVDSNEADGGLVDYKFFCFNGKMKYLYIMADRELGNGVGCAVYDADFRRLPVEREDEKKLKRDIPKPDNFARMVQIAETLAADFPEVRIDLYNNNGTILFGEMTFFDGSGYMTFDPDSFDLEMGKAFALPPKRTDK